MTTQDVALIIVAVMFGAFALVSLLDMLGVQDWCERVARETKAADREWARRSNTDTRIIAAYLADITETLLRDTEAAKTRAAVETLLAAWQPVEGTPLRWSLEWLARNTDTTTRPAPPTGTSATSKGTR